MLAAEYRTPPQSPVAPPTSSTWRICVLIDWNHPKKYCSSPSRLRHTLGIYPRQSPVAVGKLHQAPRRRQIVNALGAPFPLEEGPFGEADAEAIDAKPDSELAADAMGMDIEDDAEGEVTTTDGVVDDADVVNNTVTLCVFHMHPTYRTVGPSPRHNK